MATGYDVLKKMWLPKSELVNELHKMAGTINGDITDRKQKVLNFIVQKNIASERTTAAEVKQRFSGNINLANFFEFTEVFIKEMENKREAATLENFRKHLLRLEQFNGSRTLFFDEISPDYLIRYENHLLKKVGKNYAHALFKTIRTVFNAAIKKGITRNYPFTRFEMPEYSAPDKDYLNLAELKLLEGYARSTGDEVHRQTAIYFLFGCYSGLRISDWGLFDIKKNIVNGRVKIRAKKNGELVTMPISRPLKRILIAMKATPLIIKEPTINRVLKDIAGELKISKYLTSHCARMTFATEICANGGISVETCATLMGITTKVCAETYYRVTGNKIETEVNRSWKRLR